jgi:hypothetical protein
MNHELEAIVAPPSLRYYPKLSGRPEKNNRNKISGLEAEV